jgi:hypothetical protein
MPFILVVDCRKPKAPKPDVFRQLLEYKLSGMPVVFIISPNTHKHAEALRLYSHYFTDNTKMAYQINVWVEGGYHFSPPRPAQSPAASGQPKCTANETTVFQHSRTCLHSIGSMMQTPYTKIGASIPHFFCCPEGFGGTIGIESIAAECWQAIKSYYKCADIRYITSAELTTQALQDIKTGRQIEPQSPVPTRRQNAYPHSPPHNRQGENVPLLGPASAATSVRVYTPLRKPSTPPPEVQRINPGHLQEAPENPAKASDPCCCTIM